eukprot:gb/GFBE01047126.1/.p1 GENE.gb/GFBE01047126.1/~~gb/GFBE01047126.1/.p1  ORF type:complete len:803 (+),score=188.18 gb/GFBE01047126.1/:1-2409(+)
MPSKKHIRPGKIEASPDGTALVVHFTTEVTHLDEDGMPGRVEKTPDKREVPIGEAMRGIRPEDIPSLALEVVEKCRYIPASKTSQVEKVLTKLYGLQTSDMPFGGRGFGPGDSQSASNRSAACESVLPCQLEDMLPPASVHDLDEYVEELYEEHMEAKAMGAQRLLRVCTEVSVLEHIADHSLLLGVLSRELRENAKRSYELAVAITGIFLILSHFSRFHGTLLRNQCGEVTMRVLEYESRRRNVLQKDLQLSQGQMVARGSQVPSEERHKLERDERRCRALLDRQDHLLLLCLLVLRALSEDTALEFKLVKQKLCQLLIPLLGRQNEDLLLSTLSMLHKLTVFEQNKDMILQSEEAPLRLAELLGHPSQEVSLLALRVCYNLSFDETGRAALAAQNGLVPRLIGAVQHAVSRKVALKLLYHLSMDEHSRSSITSRHPQLASLALQLVARGKDQDPDAVGLLVNLAADEATACLLLAEDVFVAVVLRAMRNRDHLILKALRHVASHAASRTVLLDVMGRHSEESSFAWLFEMVQLAKTSAADRHEVLVEAIGTLASLQDCPSPEVPWPELCEGGLLELLPRLLMVGFSEDDVVLESVILMSNLALDAPCAALLAGSKAVQLLSDLLAAKQADGDLMVQLIFLLRCLLLCEDTRDVILHRTDVPTRVMELLRTGHGPQMEESLQAVQAAAEELLDLVVAVESQAGPDGRWTARIKEFKFKLHNEEWLQGLHGAERGDRKGRQKESSETRVPSLEASSRRGASLEATSRRDKSLEATSRRGGWADSSGGQEFEKEEKRGRRKKR